MFGLVGSWTDGVYDAGMVCVLSYLVLNTKNVKVEHRG